MNNREVVIIGAGPAGLSAAIEAAKKGADVLVLDENLKPGGQLFKQIHKFFGSKEHMAGTRGFDIGKTLLKEAETIKIEVYLNTQVCGIYQDKTLWAIKNQNKSIMIKAKRIILATGAMEKPVCFPGWTLPGVMGAGAVQTMVNMHRILPGNKALMVGSGNVGVIVAYQIMQAKGEVVAIVEAGSKIGAYGVHTAKLRRLGVPFYTGYTVAQAFGKNSVEQAEIVQLDAEGKWIKGSEKIIDVDMICLATGLAPTVELAWICGCQFTYVKDLGGHVPIHNQHMETTIKGIYVAGDITGVEEASTAMEEGRLAGIHAAASLGIYDPEACKVYSKKIWQRLNELRSGPFGEKRTQAKEHILGLGEELI